MEFSFFGYFRRWTHLVKGCLRCFGSEHTRLVSRPMKMAPLILFKFCRGEAHAGVHAEDWSAQITLIWMCKQTSNCRWRQVGQGCHRSLLWSGHLGTFDQVKLPAPQLILYVNLWREAGNTLEWLTCWCTLHREGCRWDSKPQPQNSDAVVLKFSAPSISVINSNLFQVWSSPVKRWSIVCYSTIIHILKGQNRFQINCSPWFYTHWLHPLRYSSRVICFHLKFPNLSILGAIV